MCYLQHINKVAPLSVPELNAITVTAAGVIKTLFSSICIVVYAVCNDQPAHTVEEV